MLFYLQFVMKMQTWRELSLSAQPTFSFQLAQIMVWKENQSYFGLGIFPLNSILIERRHSYNVLKLYLGLSKKKDFLYLSCFSPLTVPDSVCDSCKPTLPSGISFVVMFSPFPCTVKYHTISLSDWIYFFF